MSTTSVGKIGLDLVVNNNNLSSQISRSVNGSMQSVSKTISGSLTSGFSKLGKLVIAAFAVEKVISFGKECIGLGSDLAEVQNVVDVTFGKSASVINKWAKTTSKAYGVSELSAKQYAGTMGAMLKSMGIATNDATKMSMNLAGLAGDLASFYNLDTDEAFAKIRSGISGETEPLKQLGINMSVANLEAFALKQGITQAYTAMSQGEQALLRYKYLLSVTSDAQGDFARTSDGWANQVRVLNLNLDSLKASLGQILTRLLAPLVRALNEIIVAANGAAVSLGNLFGLNTEPEGLVEGATETEEALEGANKAAVALKKSLAGFDKLNLLSASGSKNSGSGANSNASDINPDEVVESGEAVEKTADDKILPALKRVWDGFKNFGAYIRDLCSGLGEWWSVLGRQFSELWKNNLKPFIEKTGSFLSALWHDILVPLLAWIIGGINVLVSAISLVLGTLVAKLGAILIDCCSGIMVALKGLVDFISGVFTGNWEKAWNGVKNIFVGVWEAIWAILKGILNWIIGGVNALIRGMNKISIDVPQWVRDLGWTDATKWGINIPEIPKLATGGYVKANTPQLAMIGDNKHEGEIVAPESKITEAVNAAVGPLIAEIRQLVAAVGKGGSGQTIKLYVDGKQLFEWFVKQNNSIVRQTGKSPLKT